MDESDLSLSNEYSLEELRASLKKSTSDLVAAANIKADNASNTADQSIMEVHAIALALRMPQFSTKRPHKSKKSTVSIDLTLTMTRSMWRKKSKIYFSTLTRMNQSICG